MTPYPAHTTTPPGRRVPRSTFAAAARRLRIGLRPALMMGAALAVMAVALAVFAPPLAAQEGTRYVRFQDGDRIAYGILEGETIRELDGYLFDDPRPTGRTVALGDVRLLLPVDPSRISKVVGTAVNTERPGLDLPENAHPRWFAKFPTSLSPDGAEIELPPEAENLNYEGELVVVMGRRARHVPEADALDYVFGYAVGNDYSENTWYGESGGREMPTRMISKGADSWANLGMVIVADIDYRGRRLVTTLNGEVVQDGNTEQIIQEVAELISNLSRYVTLLPGDLIYTGTVPFQEGARRRMEPGDRLEVSIEGIGSVTSTIVPMRVSLPTLPAGGEVSPAAMQDAPQRVAPSYVVDAGWPGDLPNDWILGQVSGIAVDSRDHVWVLHRPRTLTEREAGAAQDPPIADCCVPAPAVLEIDPSGNVVNAWGGPDHHPDWPPSEHGIFVDADHNVWIGSNGRGSAVVLKFTRDGRHLMTLGAPGDPGAGSNDRSHLNQPADIYVEGDEVFVADGYGNRRVVVFDAATGEYRRHWGAYGERPEDVELEPYDPDAPLVRHFRSPVHGLEITRDGLLYVADRVNNRIQVFRKDGAFVRESRVAPHTLAMGSVWDIAASHDLDQSFLFIPDGTNMKVWVVRRSDLEVVGSFGRGGRQAGQFEWLHNLDVDSHGRIYTSEVNTGKRVQRFLPAGAGGAAPGGTE